MIIYAETHNKKAFTLIELLVIISIIVVMLGILMPALNRTRNYLSKIGLRFLPAPIRNSWYKLSR